MINFNNMGYHIEIRPNRNIYLRTHEHISSDTTLFLIHGLGGRSEQWLAQIDFLKESYNLVIPDLLGHGNSSKPRPTASNNPYAFSEFSQDLEVIFHRFASKNNILIGHSYGGGLAATLSDKHQDKISKLILISPIPCAPNKKTSLITHLPAFVLEYLRPILERQFSSLAFDQSAPRSLVEKEMLAGRSNPMYMIKSMVIGMGEIPALNTTTLPTPTLIILGETDGIIPPKLSQDAYQPLPHHYFDSIPETAHMSMLEKPTQVNTVMQTFLLR
jgi:pimeloyl-ACP methyl ester carboxylesterase